MTRLITLVMGMMVLAFTAFATPNPMTAPVNNLAFNAENSFNGLAVSSSKVDVSSETNGRLNSLIATTSLVAHSTNSNNALADVTFSVSSPTADVGDQVCVDFSVTGFTDIVSIQYSMNWDATKLDYVASQNYNLTDLNAAAFGTAGTSNGDLTLSWFHNATTGVTLPDGAVIYQVCFDVLADAEGQSVAVGLSGTPTSIEVTDNTFAVQNFINEDGAVIVSGTPPPPPASGITFNVSSSTADAGTQTCLDVSVDGFTDIVSFQYSMNWDENILGYASVQNFNLTDLNAAAFGTSGTANGDLTASWIHQATTGVTVPDGTVIYQVCFDVLAGTEGETAAVSLSGAPTSIEVTNNTNAVVDFSNNNGQVSVNGTPPPPSSGVTFNVSSSTVDAGDETCLNVSVEGFTNIVSFQYSMNWDENILGYSTVQSFNLTDLNAAAFGTSGTANGDLTASWIHQATTGVTVPDGTVIYKVCFDALAGTEGQTAAVSLSGSPTSIEVTDTTSGVVDFSNNNGQVSVNGTPPPPSSGVTFNVSSSTVDAGDQTCLDVSVEGFTDIVSFQYSMNWDENILGYASVQNFNLTDLNAAAFGTSGTANGDLTASWIHQATTGVTVPDGTVIYQVCFDALSGTDGQTATIGLSGSPTSIEVTDNTGSVVDFSNNAGQVSVNDNGGGQNSSDLSFIVEEVTGENGEQVCMDISVEGFNDIVSAQYSMNWDASVLTFASVQNYNLTDLNAAAFGTSGTAAGNLTLSWIHQATTGVTVPDGTVIYQVCFDVNGTDGETVGVSISGSPTSIEVTDNTSSVITPIIDNGQVTVQGDNGGGTGNGNLTFTVEDVEGEEGEMICLDVTVDNFTDVVSAQYSMNWDPTELQFNGVQNYNLTDLNEAAFGTNGTDNGDLTMSWIHQATTGVTVPDGTVIYQVCFTVLSGVGSTPLVSFSGAPTSIEITDNTSSVIPFFSNPGQVTIVTGGGGGNDDLEFTMQTAVVEIGESFCLDVTVDNFNAIVSAQYSINWDPTVLSFTGVQGFNLTDLNASSFGTTGTANGNLTSSWFHQATTGVTLPTGTVIYQVCFDALTTTGSTNISFSGSPTSIETTTINNQIVPFTSVPGVVIIEGSDTNGPTQDNANLTFTIESETAETGDNICLDISVDDFVDIVSFQYSMVWDESILDFTGLQAFNLEDLNEPDFGQGSIDDGILTVSWIHEATTGVTVPNGTVIYQACFDVIGASGSISQVAIGGTPTSIEVTSNTSNGQDIDAEFNTGNVSVEGEVVTEDVVFQYECVDGEPGDIVCIPVSTQNFTNISSFQYSMHWNDDILSYQSVQAFGIPFLAQASFGEGNAANGSLGVVWTNDEGLGTSVPNGDVLFEICFEIIGDVGQSTLMTFDGFPTAVEVTDVSAAELPVTFLQCAVNVVNNCPAATITQNSISNVSCQGGNNGLIEVTVSGGDDAYTYQWIDNSSNGILSLSEDIGGLPAGNYTLNVTTCGGAETASQTFQVTEPNTSISISETVGTVTCFEGQDGTISVTGQGGTGSLTYIWTGGNLPANTTGTNLSGLMASTYSLTVTDANQCTMNEAFTVEQPASQLSLDATVTDVSCNGNTDGAIAIAATGGWGNYSYAWTGGLSGTNPQNLAAGMYTVTVEDQEGCEMVDELEVNQPANVVIAGTTTDVATDSPGAINITPGGGSGTGTYTYQWTGPDNYSAITEDLNNLSIGGQYCVTVTDANNCTDAQCFTINSPLIVEIDEVQFSCADESNGFINISTFGGQGTITYSWTGPGSYISDDEDINGLAGGTYIVLVTDGNGSFDTATVELTEAASAISVSPVVSQLSDDGVCDGVINVSGATGGFGGYTFLWNTVDAATTSTVTNLCAGDYTVTITDSEGCSTTSTTTIEYIPVELVADATTTSTSCFGECNGSVTVDILTGVAPYTIEIKDAAGITIASGTDLGNDGTETFGNLCAQSVLVLITDDAGQTMEIPSQVIDEPAPLTIVSSTIFPVTIAAGNNGAISVNVEGGTGEYEYDWSPGSNDQTNVNLSVGAYSVEVTDENGCSMTSEIFQLQLFEVSALDIDDADCVGDTNGEACATVAGGNGDYTYLWSSGEMTNCISEKEAGNYTVTITDVVSGVSISQEVNIETQSFLTATAAPSTLFVGGANVSCAGRSDGAATANSQGGMNDVSYVWNDSNNTNSQAISNVPAGVYTVTATDEIGCISTASVTITEPEPFSTTLEIDGISCNGQRDGAITAVPTGGASTDVAEYDYEWTGTGIVNAFLPTVSNLTEGLYTVNITDPNGCETTGTTELFEPEILEVTAVTTADDGSQNGTATAIVTGGTEDYSYEWRSNGEVGTTEELTGLAAGSYMLFVTDANGCEAMEMDIIVQDNSLGCLDTRLVITPFSSPGENDEFVINCIENYEENRLEIYNRWGQLVYTQENYDCGTDDCPNGWKGTNLRDAELAGGGYFYVLEYEEQGVTKQLKGSITILKE